MVGAAFPVCLTVYSPLATFRAENGISTVFQVELAENGAAQRARDVLTPRA